LVWGRVQATLPDTLPVCPTFRAAAGSSVRSAFSNDVAFSFEACLHHYASHFDSLQLQVDAVCSPRAHNATTRHCYARMQSFLRSTIWKSRKSQGACSPLPAIPALRSSALGDTVGILRESEGLSGGRSAVTLHIPALKFPPKLDARRRSRRGLGFFL